MWIKLLKELKYEGGIIPVGTVLWVRRSCKIDEVYKDKSYTTKGFGQVCSVYTVEYGPQYGDEYLLVLPDAEGNLYEHYETKYPKS